MLPSHLPFLSVMDCCEPHSTPHFDSKRWYAEKDLAIYLHFPPLFSCFPRTTCPQSFTNVGIVKPGLNEEWRSVFVYVVFIHLCRFRVDILFVCWWSSYWDFSSHWHRSCSPQLFRNYWREKLRKPEGSVTKLVYFQACWHNQQQHRAAWGQNTLIHFLCLL